MRWKVFKRKSTCNKKWWSDNLSPIFPLFPPKSMLTIIILKLFLILPFPKEKSKSNIVIYRVSRVKKGRNRAADIKGVVTIGIPLPRKKIMERIYIYAMYVYIYISNNETGILGYSNFLVAWRAQLCKILNILACKYWKFWTGHTVWTQGFGNVVYRADVHW